MNTEIIVKSHNQSCNFVTALALAILFLLSFNHQIFSQTASTGHTSTSVQSYSANPAFLSFADTVFLWGPTFPPPLGSIFIASDSAGTGAIGRTGGNNWFHSDVNLASLTTVYWGFVSDSIMMSFDDSIYSDTVSTMYSEVMTYRPDSADLANGIALWAGETRLPGNATPVYTRFTVTIKDQVGDTTLALVDASSLGLPADVGGVVLVTDSLAYKANLQVLASYDSTTGFIPALDFYDANTLADSGAFTSISAGFYWENVPPVLDSIGPKSETEGIEFTFSISATDLEGSIPELTSSTLPAGAAFIDSLNGVGTFSWTPGFVASGTYDITFYAFDSLDTDSEVVTITVVDAGNQPPAVTPVDSQTTTEGVLLVFDVFATDPEDIPTLTAPVLPNGASFADSGNGRGTFEWTPGFLQSGIHIVTFIATDDSSAVDSHQVTITVSDGGNQSPVLDSIGAQGTSEGVNHTFAVTATDIEDTPGLSTSVLPPGASFVDSGNGAGSFSWTPGFLQAGVYEITFYATDDSSAVDSEIVTFTVDEAGNQDPKLIRNNTLVVDEGASGIITSSLLEATDAESPPADIFFIVAPDSLVPPIHGNVNLLGVPLGAGETFSQEDVDSGRVTYVHDGSETTSDGFPFRVMDADGGIASDGGFDVFFFNISINPVNDSPVVNDTSYVTGVGIPFNGKMTGSDPDLDALSYFITKNGNLGVATILNSDSGTFLYTPFADSVGIDSLEFKAFDGTTFSAPGLIEITIQNIPPVANDGSGSTNEGVLLTDTLTAFDPDTAQTLSFHIDLNGALGIASILDSLTGEFTYTPDTDAFGIDTFTFVVSDGQDSSLPGRYIVSIRPNIDPGDLLVAESDSDAVVLVDPQTGNQGILFSGDKLSNPKTIAIEDDGNLLVVDADSGLIRIDVVTGVQTILSPSSNFAPSSPVGPIGITIESSGNILIADAENGVVRVDPVLGTVTTVSVGNNLTLAVGIVLDSNGDIFASDASAFSGGISKLIRIDPATGNQRLISSGGNLTVPIGIAIDDNGDIWICDGGSVAGGTDIIMRIDTASGVQTVISTADLLNFPTGIAVSTSGTLYIANQSSASVVSVDTSTGIQTLITSGGSLYRPFGLTLVPTPCCIGIRGDYNGDGQDATVLDLTFLIDDIFRGGASAACQDETDLNNDGQYATVLDLTFLIDDIFRGGPSAPACP
ncbi:MAG: hypothetical protein IH931_03020 [candidate division Zixibacteria bacterium]|nr:hypothetical protein [candidate division Zixibacteria bacterium]